MTSIHLFMRPKGGAEAPQQPPGGPKSGGVERPVNCHQAKPGASSIFIRLRHLSSPAYAASLLTVVRAKHAPDESTNTLAFKVNRRWASLCLSSDRTCRDRAGCMTPSQGQVPSSPAPVFTVAPPNAVAVPKEGDDNTPPDLSRFSLADIFELEWAADPRIAPDGRRIVYVRRFMDKMKDVRRSHLWIIDRDGSNHRPLVTGDTNISRPRWSPTGDRLAYATKVEGKVQIVVRWMDTGQTAAVTRLTEGPGAIAWSPRRSNAGLHYECSWQITTAGSSA